MKKTTIAVLLGVLAALASPSQAVVTSTLVNEPALSYSKTFAIDLNSIGIGAVTAQAIYSSATVPPVVFTDGAQSSGSFLVVTPSALAAATATDRITVANNAGLAKAVLSVPGGNMLRQGYEWQIGATAGATAINIAAAINRAYPQIRTSVAGSVIYATAPAPGSVYNTLTLHSSTPTAMTVLSPIFTGGQDNAVILVNGQQLVAGQHWSPVGATTDVATSIAAAINANTVLNRLIVATPNSPTDGYVALVSIAVSPYTNYSLASSAPSALTASGSSMTGGNVASDYTKGSPIIHAAGHGLTLGLPVLYTAGAVAIAPLVNQTTYYAFPVDANNIKLATSAAHAIAGDLFVTLVSSSALPGHNYTLAPLGISGTPSFKWQVSANGSSWTDFAGSVNITTPGQTNWNFGAIGWRYLRLNATGPTTGGIALNATVTMSNTVSLDDSSLVRVAATANLVGIDSDLATTTLFAPSVAGLYKIAYYIVCTNTGSGDTVPQLVFNYTDETGGNAINATMPANPNATLASGGISPIYMAASTPLTYALGSGAYSNGSAYSIYVVVEKL